MNLQYKIMDREEEVERQKLYRQEAWDRADAIKTEDRKYRESQKK